MAPFDLEAWMGRARAIDLDAVPWVDVARHPVSPEVVRTLTFMQDIEFHTITGYNRLKMISTPPVRRRRGTARAARLLVDRFWAPVGSGVAAPTELRFMAHYLFAGDEGRQAARKVDDTIRKLPGFTDARLLEAWMDRHIGLNGRNGGQNGHGH